MVAGQLPPDRQGHPDHPQRLLAHDAQGDRAADAAHDLRARLVADRRHQDEQVARQRGQSDGYDRKMRRGCVPLLPVVGNVAGQRRQLQRGELRGPLQQRPCERPRQPAEPGAENDAPLRRRDPAPRRTQCRRPRTQPRSRNRDRRDGNQPESDEVRPGAECGDERRPRRKPLSGKDRAVGIGQERRSRPAQHRALHRRRRAAPDFGAARAGDA